MKCNQRTDRMHLLKRRRYVDFFLALLCTSTNINHGDSFGTNVHSDANMTSEHTQTSGFQVETSLEFADEVHKSIISKKKTTINTKTRRCPWRPYGQWFRQMFRPQVSGVLGNAMLYAIISLADPSHHFFGWLR